MPFINIKYSGEIPFEEEEQIKYALGEASQIIGKSEQWTMICFEQNRSLYFNGEKSEKIAFVEVSLFTLSPLRSSAYDQFTEEVCKTLNIVLGVPPERIYVKYSLTEHWGWNGRNL